VADYRAGDTVRYRVTWLEMTQRPRFDWPRLPVGREGMLVRADAPPHWYFLALYDAVGRDHAWTDQFQAPTADLDAWLAHPDVGLYTLMSQGWPHGFFMLDGREGGVCDLAYFGLVPQAVGRGLGWWLLQTAILTAWARPGTERLTVNTCTLDHPRALGQYQRAGFEPVRTEERARVLVRDLSFPHPLL
jgi:GNAT superfamily N-acetyltransferase